MRSVKQIHVPIVIKKAVSYGVLSMIKKGKQTIDAPNRQKASATKAKKTVKVRAPQRTALLIGNGRLWDADGSKLVYDLPGIDKDLAMMGEVLSDKEYAGFNVVSLMEPTLIDLRREIARTAFAAGPDDTLLIYYSGTSTVGGDGLLYLPVSDSDEKFLEATCLDSEYVLSCLRRCQSRRQVLIIDGCHSGAFFTNNRGIPDGFCAITACGPDEYSYGDSNGGFFTRLLVEGLRGATADLDGDGVVTVDELFRYVYPRAQASPASTTPQMWSWNLPEPIPLVQVRQRVFMSYQRANSGIADKVMQRLESAGYGVWLDRSDIGGGSQWREEVDKAIQQADAVIFLLSKPALESDEVYRELTRAVELGKAIVPLRLDKSPLYGWFKQILGRLQHIEYDDQDTMFKWWSPLLAALRRIRRAQSRYKVHVEGEKGTNAQTEVPGESP